MTTDPLKSLVDARPFLPFALRIADGRRIDVEHPEAIGYRGGRIAVVFITSDAVEIIDLPLVPSFAVGAG